MSVGKNGKQSRQSQDDRSRRRKNKKEKMQREKKEKFRKSMVEEEMEIERMIEENQKKKEDLIEIRMVEEMVSRRFHKYLKIFEKS